ncbi:MAG TPA: ATP-binding cassette domain-containing protein, partial [Bacteroidales bacterium]|nr:ATP-binding cassette domain-containing protein [Bacteroidales bacterium]
MLTIKNLHVSIKGKEILKGIDLQVNRGEVHAIMGPNGTGKSTLAAVIGGKESYEVTAGSITYKGKNLFDLSIEDRAREGVFIGFQYPVEIPGVSITNFMRTALDEIRQYRGLEPLTPVEFLKLMEEKKKMV